MKNKISLIIAISILILGCSICGIQYPKPTATVPFITPLPGLDQIQIVIMADRTNITSGECALLQWAVTGPVQIVQLDGVQVTPTGQKQVCPPVTTTYTLAAGTGSAEGLKTSAVIITVVEATLTVAPTLIPTTKAAPPQVIPPTATKKVVTKTPTQTELPPPSGGGSWGQIKADLHPTDYFSQGGNIYIKIKNDGPGSPSNLPVGLTCGGQISNIVDNSLLQVVPTINKTIYFSGTPGMSASFDTGYTIIPGMLNNIGCTITPPEGSDPNPNNNYASGTIIQ